MIDIIIIEKIVIETNTSTKVNQENSPIIPFIKGDELQLFFILLLIIIFIIYVLFPPLIKGG